MFEFDLCHNLMTNFSHHHKRMGSRLLKKVNKVLTTNFTAEIENPAHNLFLRSTNFRIQSYYWTCRTPKTSNPDKLINLELWGVNVDFKSYEKKWTIHGIIQTMGFYPQQRIQVS